MGVESNDSAENESYRIQRDLLAKAVGNSDFQKKNLDKFKREIPKELLFSAAFSERITQNINALSENFEYQNIVGNNPQAHEKVRIIQNLLHQFGYDIQVDGWYGKPSGKPTVGQSSAQMDEKGLKESETRGAVRKLQEFLGLSGKNIDGLFGNTTFLAIKEHMRKLEGGEFKQEKGSPKQKVEELRMTTDEGINRKVDIPEQEAEKPKKIVSMKSSGYENAGIFIVKYDDGSVKMTDVSGMTEEETEYYEGVFGKKTVDSYQPSDNREYFDDSREEYINNTERSNPDLLEEPISDADLTEIFRMKFRDGKKDAEIPDIEELHEMRKADIL